MSADLNKSFIRIDFLFLFSGAFVDMTYHYFLKKKEDGNDLKRSVSREWFTILYLYFLESVTVVVEPCSNHWVWLSAHELRRVQAAWPRQCLLKFFGVVRFQLHFHLVLASWASTKEVAPHSSGRTVCSIPYSSDQLFVMVVMRLLLVRHVGVHP